MSQNKFLKILAALPFAGVAIAYFAWPADLLPLMPFDDIAVAALMFAGAYKVQNSALLNESNS